MAHEPIPDPSGGGILSDLGTREGRVGTARYLAQLAREHHDTALEAMECTLITVLTQELTDLVASASGLIGETGIAVAEPFVTDILASGAIQLWRLVLIGEVAEVCGQLRAQRPAPNGYAGIVEELAKGDKS